MPSTWSNHSVKEIQAGEKLYFGQIYPVAFKKVTKEIGFFETPSCKLQSWESEVLASDPGSENIMILGGEEPSSWEGVIRIPNI